VAIDASMGGEYDPALTAESLRGGLVLGGCTASQEAYNSGQCQSLASAAGQESIKAASASAGSWTDAIVDALGDACRGDVWCKGQKDTLTSPAARRWGPVAGGTVCLGLSVATLGSAAAVCGLALFTGEFVIQVYEFKTGQGDRASAAAFAAGATCAAASRKLGPVGKGLELDQACQALAIGFGAGLNAGSQPRRSNPYLDPRSSKRG
jgi:hypothetical protein